MLIFFVCYLCVFNVNFVVIQNISASFSELFPNYVPPDPLCLEKWGVMTPPAPMGAPPLPDRGDRPAFTPTGQVGTRFIDPVRMKG